MMGDYIYERFTPDRFQDFVSSLLAAEYTGYQVFPVGQADGGRDGRVQTSDGPSIVIQVKFKRVIKAGEDYYKWLTNAISEELPNIKRLARNGATEYIIVTNVPGTAKAETGTMDKIQNYLNATLPIRAKCLWRDDLDARLNGNYDLKWFYSEIMATPDVVRQLMSEGLSEHRERRIAAITGYMRSQYETDAYVKFKQAELQASDLLNLFVDVPGELDASINAERSGPGFSQTLRRMVEDVLSKSPKGDREDVGYRYRRARTVKKERPGGRSIVTPALPAGTLLLHSAFAGVSPRTVVEGAPGQGKSTLAQYLCQVHRMVFLNRESDLDRIPGDHRLTPSRIPFKVDLRDLSQWIEGIDHRRAPDREPHERPPTLETFLAHEVEHLSGGQKFDASDLYALARAAPLLMVLDGFDEVATPSQRLAIVEEVDRALMRLRDGSLSIQAVVTSRPSALPDSPRFPTESWQYLSLASISKPLALEYAERWAKARNLEPEERTDIERILASKLESPHLRDLARNPMQLTILLMLIHLRGQSLPDQRTAMYDSYIEVFFNREAEKTEVVRDNRQLLIDLHGFLAWTMHSDAEASGGDGRITTDELKRNIEKFLIAREYPAKAVEPLFEGVVQRIVALVSRTEGTFEFEVQPLREYFAAHHLYHTSPYSPPGNPVSGTKPEILAALMANPYWQNVLRFFAGFYSVGELPGLASDLISALEDPSMANPIYYRNLAINMLSDWVFHQSPAWTRKLVEAAVDPLALRTTRAQDPWRSASIAIDLPIDCGGRRAAEIAFENLPVALTHNIAAELAAIAATNLRAEDMTASWWQWASEHGPEGSAELLRIAGMLGILHPFGEFEYSRLESLWPEYNQLRTDLILHGAVECSRSDEDRRDVVRNILDGHGLAPLFGGPWAEISWALHPARLANLLQERESGYASIEVERPQHDAVDEAAVELVRKIRQLELRKELDFRSSLTPWQELVELVGDTGGDTLTGYLLGNLSAGIVSSEERGAGNSSLFNSTTPLTGRCRYARMQAGRPTWWLSQYDAATSALQREAWAALCLTWASPATRDECGPLIDNALSEMREERFLALADWLSMLPISLGRRAAAKKSLAPPVSERNLRRHFILSLADAPGYRSRFITDERKLEFDFPKYARAHIAGWALRELPARPSVREWDSFLAEIGRLTSDLFMSRIPLWDAPLDRIPNAGLTQELSRTVVSRALRMPLSAVTAADWRLSTRQSRLRPLAITAAEQGWNVG